MRISFDLDDTLICHDHSIPREGERVPWILRGWIGEPLRLGTAELLKQLQTRGHEVWIYTTSFRSPMRLRWLFRFYGVRLGGVVNQRVHDRECKLFTQCSKAPHRFGIALHVDNSAGVAKECRGTGVEVLVIDPADMQWAEKILLCVDSIESTLRLQRNADAVT